MARVALKKTEHPHIARHPKICGGSPVIRGTRITVRLLATLARCGETPEGILQAYPHLTLAQIHDALSYYFDHRQEIAQEIEDEKLAAVMQRLNLALLPHPSGGFGRLVTPEEFRTLSEEERKRARTWEELLRQKGRESNSISSSIWMR